MTNIETPPLLTVVSPGAMDTPTVTVTAAYRPAEGRYAAASVSVEHPFGQVRGAELRAVPVRRLLAELLRTPLAEANPTLMENRAVKAWASGKDGRRPAAKQVLNPDSAHLASAAAVMRLERIVGGFPIRAVERACGIGYEDAKRWARLIKKEGLA